MKIARQPADDYASSLAKDTARLDFVLQAQAFIVTAPSREQHGTLYQLWTQDEDENFHIISGDGHFFISQRAAIDAAIMRRAHQPAATVKAKCIGCGKTRDIKPNEIKPGDHPMCDVCLMPMIAVSAKVKL